MKTKPNTSASFQIGHILIIQQSVTMLALKRGEDGLWEFRCFHEGRQIGSGWIESEVRWNQGERIEESLVELVDGLIRVELPGEFQTEAPEPWEDIQSGRLSLTEIERICHI